MTDLGVGYQPVFCLTLGAQYVLVLFVLIEPPAAASVGIMQDPPDMGGSQEHGGDEDVLMLRELAEIGMKMARAVGRQMEPPCAPDPQQADDLARAFSRISRAVRLTLALKKRFAEPTARPQQVAIKPVDAGTFAERQQHRRRKAQVRYVVEQMIKAGAERREAESLFVDLRERLKEPDIDEELGHRPIGEIIGGICDDLGIEQKYGLVDDAALQAVIAEGEAFYGAAKPEAEGPSVLAAEPRAPP
jgi:hypothetical protein